MNVLILEDEIPAFNKLLKHLQIVYSERLEYHWARSNAEAEAFLKAHTYDLILSDIQLLDGLSFDVFNKINVLCPIIFCSAYDNYLFEAFKTFGIAYILKPYTEADFNEAITKFKQLFNTHQNSGIDKTTLKALKQAIQEPHYKSRFVIKRASGIHLLQTDDISCIEASGDFCIATDVNGKRHNISEKIGQLITLLNPSWFFRINRSQIVNIKHIEKLDSHFKNRLVVFVKGKKEQLISSSSSTPEFRKWLEK